MNERDYTPLRKIKNGETCTRPVMLMSMVEKTTSNGDPYVSFTICDSESSSMANKFKCGEGVLTLELVKSKGYEPGQVLMMKLSRNEKGYLNVDGFGPNTDSDVTVQDFAHRCDGDPVERFNNIIKILEDVAFETRYLSGEVKETLCDLALALLRENEDKICWAAAAEKMHSEKAGGLMEHTEAMVRTAIAICDVYPDLDKDLLVAGTAIHDIAKIEEMNTDEIGHVTYTFPGIAIGHIVLGYSYIDRYYINHKDDYSEERVILLKSMILSHHGKKEYGSPIEPITTEAYFLNLIDNMDALYHEMKKAKDNIEPGEISPDNRVLGINHRIYRPTYEV